jgi:predicted DNA repair protein MutK
VWVAESGLQGETVLQEGATIELLGLSETILVFGHVAVAVEYDDDELTGGIW